MKTSSGGYTQGKQGELPTIKMAETTEREQELSALHRSYRMMETDRQKYNEESQVRRCPATLPLAASDLGDAVVEGRASTTAIIIFTCFCFLSLPALSLSSCCCGWLTASPPLSLARLPHISSPLQNIIKRQRQAIEKIRKENERLKEQLKAESQQNAAATEGNTVSVISGD